jgi:glycosyltransferase involved in cell wall biosynthesis
MTSRRRVVIATETYVPEIGGGETQARMLAQSFLDRGIGVTLVTRHSRPDTLVRERLEGVDIVRVPPAGRGRWRKWGLSFTALPALVEASRDAQAVLVSGFRILGAPAVLATRLTRVPVVLKADNRGELSGEYFRSGLSAAGLTPASLPVRMFVGTRNALLRRSEAFVALSEEMAAEFVSRGVSPERLHRIPNGVDIEQFRPADPATRRALRHRLGLPDGRIVVFTGRLVRWKGLPLLARAWERLVRDGIRATLLLVGKGGMDMHACEDELRAFARDHGLADAIRFTGVVPNVDDYLRASDAFAFPTTDDAFGISLVEAMACALPVVSTHVGAIRDFLIDGGNGIVVPVGDEVALANALRRLVQGGTDIDALGQAARETAVTRFSHQTVADAYVRLVGSLGASREAA